MPTKKNPKDMTPEERLAARASDSGDAVETETDAQEMVADQKAGAKEVRVYEILDSTLEYRTSDGLNFNETNTRTRGERIGSHEFEPVSLEKRYLDAGAIRLVDTTTRADWEANRGQ